METTVNRLEIDLAANVCPLCQKRHRKGTTTLSRHADTLEREHWYGYNYTKEAWLHQDKDGRFEYVTNAKLLEN